MTQNTEQNVRTREEHRDAQCIEHIARLMREKMKFSREVKGRSGWQDIPADVLSEMLREHVEKGDPVDVANFCMMLAAKRAPISDARGAAEQRRKGAATSDEALEEMTVERDNAEEFIRKFAERVLGHSVEWSSSYGFGAAFVDVADRVDALEARIAELEVENARLHERSLPERLTDPLREVLGRMCFECISLASALRADGQVIPNRAEDEQAAVVFFLLPFVLAHGKDWREAAGVKLDEMEKRYRAALTREGGV